MNIVYKKMSDEEKKNSTVQTRRVEILPVNGPELDSEINGDYYKILRDYRYNCWKLSNHIMTSYYLLNKEAQRRKNENDLKESLSAIKKVIVQEWTNDECQTVSNYNYWISGEFKDQIPSSVRAGIGQSVSKKFDSEIKDVNCGRRSLTTYRLNGVELPFPHKNSKLEKNKENFYFKPNFKESSWFFLKFGKDKSNNRIIFENILNGNYRLADSYLKFDKKGKKLYFYVCFYSPKQKNVLHENVVLGVDLGIRTPAVCATNTNEKYKKFVGNGKYIEKKRKEFEYKKKDLYNSLNCVSVTGKGYDKKMAAIKRLTDRESRFFKNINQNMSKVIVDEAVKQKAKTINFELLSGIENVNKNLRNWTYFSLLTLVQTKASKHDIVVKTIDPYHTSQICSVCGNHDKGQRNKEVFICKNEKCTEYNKKVHADFNAARNIAKSEVYKKEKTT